jgi:hypothetical protein
MARFDWYQATVRAEAPEVRECVLAGLGGSWEPLHKAPHGYGFGDRLVSPEGSLALLWWGGSHAHPHVVFSGEDAQAGSELLRTHFPGHAVSRADPCLDYAEPGAYDRLQDVAVGIAKDRGIRVGTAGDHLVTLKGRTLYLGSTSSHTRLRLYDKAAELREKFAADPVRLLTVPPELARLECQVRPQTAEAKAAAAVASPIELMGSAAWMRELMRQVSGLELEPFQAGRGWRQSDDARAYSALLAQYGGLLLRVCGDLGSWECLGLQIGHDLAEREAAMKRRRYGGA